jgi:competence protein ComGC
MMKKHNIIIVVVISLLLTISCGNTQKKEESEDKKIKEEFVSLIDSTQVTLGKNGLTEVETIFNRLDKEIVIDKTTPEELAQLYSIKESLYKNQYLIDTPCQEYGYKTMLIFTFEEGVLNSITSSSAVITRGDSIGFNHKPEVLAFLKNELGVSIVRNDYLKEYYWSKTNYRVCFRDYDDGNWSVWIQSNLDYFSWSEYF